MLHEPALRADAFRTAEQRERASAQVRQLPIRHRIVIARQVELGEALRGEHDPLRMAERHSPNHDAIAFHGLALIECDTDAACPRCGERATAATSLLR